MEKYYSLYNSEVWERAFNCSLYSLGRSARRRVLDYLSKNEKQGVEGGRGEFEEFLSQLEKILEKNLI